MVLFSEPLEANAAEKKLTIWAEDDSCKNDKYCNFASRDDDNKKARIYIVRVTAIDKAGNAGVGECSTIVVKEKYRQETQIDDYPFFFIAKRDIVGGVEPASDDVEDTVEPAPSNGINDEKDGGGDNDTSAAAVSSVARKRSREEK